MGQLPAPVPLYDIRDAEAFLGVVLRDLRLVLEPDEREELHAAGLVLMVELAADYRPHIGTFAGYAGRYLPGRLLSAWHVLGGHSRRREFDERGVWTGRRVWVRPAVVSLDAELARGIDERRLIRL